MAKQPDSRVAGTVNLDEFIFGPETTKKTEEYLVSEAMKKVERLDKENDKREK